MLRACVWLLLLAAPLARAAAVLRIDETRSITVAVGLKTGFLLSRTAGPAAVDLTIDGAILSLSGQFDPAFKLTLNSARMPTGELRILDAVARYEPNDRFNLWAGRFLVATDRPTLVGPFFGAAWDPAFVSVLPNLGLGRSDGVTAWGALAGGRLKYAAGVFRGRDGALTAVEDLMYTARASWSFGSLEPGYYATGTYFGARDVLTIGAGGRLGLRSAGPADARGSFSALTADVFGERRFGGVGVFTLDAAVYRYARAVADPVLPDGPAWYALVGWMPPVELGQGRVQLTLREQSLVAARRDRIDGTVSLLLSGSLLRFTLGGWNEWTGADRRRSWGAKLGAQIIL